MNQPNNQKYLLTQGDQWFTKMLTSCQGRHRPSPNFPLGWGGRHEGWVNHSWAWLISEQPS